MAWNDAAELTVGGTGQVYVAPVGTALPTDPTAALNPAFVGLGYTSEDGVTFTISPDVTDFRVWQSRQAARRELNAQEVQAAFELAQWNEETVPLAFGGGAVTTTTNGYRYDFPAGGDALDERAMVIDVEDGARVTRFVMPKGNVTDDVATQFRRTELAILPITFKALAQDDGSPAYVLFSDEAAFAAGS